MSGKKHSEICEHKNQLMDYHEGSYVCVDCAKVMDTVFVPSFEQNLFETNYETDFKDPNCATSEISHRLNIPSFNVIKEKKEIKNISKLYLLANENKFTVTLKEMSAVSGYSCKQIGKELTKTVSILDLPTLLEKYCKLLEIDYKMYAVIKEKMLKNEQTGHNPLTIIASHIYTHLKTVKDKKLSMKKICDVIGISSISIQRYLKTLK